MSVVIAARMVAAPIKMLSCFEVNTASTHKPPNVPRNLPAVIQPAPERSSAARSRQATYTLSGIISTSRHTGTRSGARNAQNGCDAMSAKPTPVVP